MSNIKIGDKLLGGELEVIDIQGNLILCISRFGSPCYYGMKDGSCLSDDHMVNIGNHTIRFELTENNYYNRDRLLCILEEACRDHLRILNVSVSGQLSIFKYDEVMADRFKFSIFPDDSGLGLGIWFKISNSDGKIEKEIFVKDREILNIKLSDPSHSDMIMYELKKAGFL